MSDAILILLALLAVICFVFAITGKGIPYLKWDERPKNRKP